MLPEETQIEIALGTVYSLEYVLEFKKKLEIREGEDLFTQQNSKQFFIYCSNEAKDICSFKYAFTKKIDVDSQQVGLEFKRKVTIHSFFCKVNNEADAFERNRSLLVSSKDLTTKIILSRYKIFGPQNPKKILEVLSQTLGYQEAFINKNLRNTELKRRLKKKFDNLVAQIRRQHNLSPTQKKFQLNARKQRNKFSIQKQKLQDPSNEGNETIEIISDFEQNQSEQSEFKPYCRAIKLKTLSEKRQIHEKQTVKEECNSAQFVQNFQSSTRIAQKKGKRKLIIKS